MSHRKQTPYQLRRHKELMAEHQRLVNAGTVLPCGLFAQGSGALAVGAFTVARGMAITAQAETGTRMSARDISEIALGLMAARQAAAQRGRGAVKVQDDSIP